MDGVQRCDCFMLHDNAAAIDTPLQALLVVFVIRTYEHACSTLNGMSTTASCGLAVMLSDTVYGTYYVSS